MSNLIHKRIKAEKTGDKDRKGLYKLMKNALYGKTMENLRKRTDVKLVSNAKDYLKWASKPRYVPQKIFGNDLVAISKSYINIYKPA